MAILLSRIRELREQAGLSQKRFANKIGVSEMTVRRWESAERSPSTEALLRISQALNASVAYLVGQTDDPASPTKDFPVHLHLAKDSDEFDEFMQSGRFPLPENDEKAYLMGETDDPAPPREARPAEPSPGAVPRRETNVSGYIPIGEMYPVPYYDIKSCAGNGVAAFLEDVELIRTIPLPLEWIGAISTDDSQKPFLTRIDGDSMEASGLPDGMLALVNPAEDVYSGQAALVCFGENRERAIKHVYYLPNGGIELRSASSEYPVITYSRKQHRPMDEWEDGSDSLDIIGRVMGAWGEPKRR